MGTVHAVTLDLPETVYNQIQRAAEKVHRPVEDIMVEAVVAAAPGMNTAPIEMRSSLAQMAYLNDAALWQAARATIPAEQRMRLEVLHQQQQAGDPLTVEEEAEEQALLALYRETLLVRAQAAVLLKQRNYDVENQTGITR
jgi:hypothetical protein